MCSRQYRLLYTKVRACGRKLTMKHDLFELSVAVPSSHGFNKIPEYGRNGLTYVEGRRGQPYVLKVRNDSAQRVLAVISIDGLNVLDGEPCTPSSRGYVIPAYATVDIQGWRTNLSEAHRFTFNEKGKSYSAKSGNGAQNCGVIAAMIFSEKYTPVPPEPPVRIVEHHHHHYPKYPIITPITPWWGTPWCGTTGDYMATYACELPPAPTNEALCCNSSVELGQQMRSALNNAQAAPKFQLGTGWGDAVVDKITETVFERAAVLCTLTLYYAEGRDLESIGVELKKKPTVTPTVTPALPQAFPGFCKPPSTR